MTREVMRYKLNELRMMLNDGEHTEEQGILTDIIKELDKAENKGKWEKIWRTDCECSEYVCSKCGCGEDYWTNFCPTCGADMIGVSE